jgi:hypothetical protein
MTRPQWGVTGSRGPSGGLPACIFARAVFLPVDRFGPRLVGGVTPNRPKRLSGSDFDSLAILKDKLAHEWRQRLEQALAARFDQVECLLIVARRAAIGIGDVDGAACGAEAGEH